MFRMMWFGVVLAAGWAASQRRPHSDKQGQGSWWHTVLWMFTSFNLRKERQPLPNVVSQLEVTVLSQDLPFTSHRMQVVALIWDYFLTQTVVSLTKSSWFCLFLDASCSLIILWLELHLCCLPMQQSFACLLLAFAFLRSRRKSCPEQKFMLFLRS